MYSALPTSKHFFVICSIANYYLFSLSIKRCSRSRHAKALFPGILFSQEERQHISLPLIMYTFHDDFDILTKIYKDYFPKICFYSFITQKYTDTSYFNINIHSCLILRSSLIKQYLLNCEVNMFGLKNFLTRKGSKHLKTFYGNRHGICGWQLVNKSAIRHSSLDVPSKECYSRFMGMETHDICPTYKGCIHYSSLPFEMEISSVLGMDFR